MIIRPNVVVERRRASVGELHGDLLEQLPLTPDAAVAVVWCDFIDRALVLGSRQPIELADTTALDGERIHLVKRRSGGGAVLMDPDEMIWLDIVAAPNVFSADVRGSMVAAGRWWAEALADVGAIRTDVEVYNGPMDSGRWGQLVCFAGLGPGEVLLDGRKLVGLSQRRTRLGVRISGAVHRRSIVGDTPRFLRGEMPGGAPPEAAVIESVETSALAGALASAVARSIASVD